MSLYALRYEYDAHDDTGRRDQLRPAHVDFVRDLFQAGVVVLSGPLVDRERPGGLLIVRADDVSEVERIFDQDPFWTAGLVGSRDIRAWNVVFANNPLE
ncbi:YciI family protein [Spongiactinospora sp. TRM90649]|uniref:YciI family protein n=1 Tax=Spongiactinospora sp. TRM90649 TaxID=3031114 RepID=UPI0023F9CBA3|nr:YciI family protein [Spongiactinospora sp. TRM90649]MDF5757600.1 YciI family protein [Spongiactinospora sp. TRM90649]